MQPGTRACNIDVWCIKCKAKNCNARSSCFFFFLLPWWESKTAITTEKPLREEPRTNKLNPCMALRMESSEGHKPAKEEVV